MNSEFDDPGTFFDDHPNFSLHFASIVCSTYSPLPTMSTLFAKTKNGASRRKRLDGEALSPIDSHLEALETNNFQTLRVSTGTNRVRARCDDIDETNAAESPTSFDQLGLAEPLVATCRKLGFRQPTPVQSTLIPYLIRHRDSHVLAIAATGTGKTAAYVLPILHHLSTDPYGVYAVLLAPTRELAMQVHQQVLALGASYSVVSVLVVGGLDAVQQSVQLDQKRPHFIVATPGRLAALLRGPQPPPLQHVCYLVLDEADRLLAGTMTTTTETAVASSKNSSVASKFNQSNTSSSSNCGFERDVAEILLHCRHPVGESNSGTRRRRQRDPCQTLLFSATMTASLQTLQDLAGDDEDDILKNSSSLPLRKFIIRQNEAAHTKEDARSKKKNRMSADPLNEQPDSDEISIDSSNSATAAADADDLTTTVGVKIPNGLQQEYVFMPARVREAYLLATVRTLLANGGRSTDTNSSKRTSADKKHQHRNGSSRKQSERARQQQEAMASAAATSEEGGDQEEAFKAKSAIIFVSTCERAALISGILEHVGVPNVALHSLLSQHRRLAALGKFQSEQVRVMVATDVAARGLDVPHTDLVINAELPRNPVNYVHRVGRTARAGRRGRAVSLVAESDVALVHAAEEASGRPLLKCLEVTDEIAVTMLNPAAKAARLTKLKLADIGFEELVKKMKERKVRDRQERQQRERRANA